MMFLASETGISKDYVGVCNSLPNIFPFDSSVLKIQLHHTLRDKNVIIFSPDFFLLCTWHPKFL